MEKLISRWNREKTEAFEEARVFDVEERENCLILSKRFAPFRREAIAGVVFALFWVGAILLVFYDSTGHRIWIGWLILWMLFGPMLAFPHIRRAWRVWQGDIWVFNRNSGQVEHNGVSIMPLSQMKSVLAHESRTKEGRLSSLWVKQQNSKVVVLTNLGKHKEHLQVGQQIANFVRVRFNPPGW